MRSWLAAWMILVTALVSPLASAKVTNVKLGAKPEAQARKDRSGPSLHLVAIAVNQYQDPFWRDLRWAVRDAQRLGEALSKQSSLRVQTYPLLNQAATLPRVQSLFHELSAKMEANDILMVYLSGHGTLQISSDGELVPYFVLHTTQAKDLASTGLSHNWLRNAMDRLPAKNKVLMVASCHSGVGKSRLSSEVKEFLASHKGAPLPLADVGEGSLVFAAASKWETAEESQALQGDTYTNFFIEGLSLGDRNRDGAVSALEAHDYASERTYAYTRGKQRPTVEAKFVGSSDIILVGRVKRTPEPILQAYHADFAGMQLSVDKGSGKSRLPLAFPLKKGGNIVRLYPPNAKEPIASYRVYAQKGEVLNLEDLAYASHWSAQVSYRHFTYLDPTYARRLAASSGGHLAVAYHHRRWVAGLNYQNIPAAQHDLDLGIRGKLARQSLEATLGFERMLWAKTNATASLHLGPAWADLSLSEQEKVSPAVTSAASSWAFGARLELSSAIDSKEGLYGTLGVAYGQSKFDFGYYGKADASSVSLELGLRYHFWEKATPL